MDNENIMQIETIPAYFLFDGFKQELDVDLVYKLILKHSTINNALMLHLKDFCEHVYLLTMQVVQHHTYLTQFCHPFLQSKQDNGPRRNLENYSHHYVPPIYHILRHILLATRRI